MSRFIQLHLLTSYPPANLNRDDLGRPKTAIMGGAPRLRISSQSLKRAWRDSEIFNSALKEFKGTRTKRIGVEWAYDNLINAGLSNDAATMWSHDIQEVFGEPESTERGNEENRNDLLNKQLVFIAPSEINAIGSLTNEIADYCRGDEPCSDLIKEVVGLQEQRSNKKKNDDKKKITKKIKKLLQPHLLKLIHSSADIALFGRMLASSPAYNTEAAAQVAHAISVHRVTVEDDFFTAVDDLNSGEEDLGAGHMGETEFAAGLFYLYACIDRELLQENLGGDQDLTNRTLAALVECAATVAPTGKQNSFASRARASYILCESGNQQPRSLSVAFLKPVNGTDMLNDAIRNLDETVTKMDEVYGACADRRCTMNAATGEGSLREIIGTTTE